MLYAERLFADIVIWPLGLALLKCPPDWLAQLPRHYLRRDVRFGTLAEARRFTTRTFIQPALDKCFHASVYFSGAALPATVASLSETTPVLCAEPV